jgi:integrase
MTITNELMESPINPKKIQGHAKYSMREQVDKYIAAHANRGKSKASGAKLRSDRTVERYRGDLTRAAEAIQYAYGITRLKDITQEQAQTYLNQRNIENIRARTVQGSAKALELLPNVKSLDAPSRRDDPNDKPKGKRAYTILQVQEIQKFFRTHDSILATQIILESGCRTQDLASLRLACERPIKNAQFDKLHPDRFAGREDWVKISFIGKGGHEYISTISPETAKTLELYRLNTPRDFRERKQENVVTKQYYDIPAGKILSMRWNTASGNALNLKRGLHGLRHTFAQERVKDMQRAGMTWEKALECVSQQMGHYRASEVKTYLR